MILSAMKISRLEPFSRVQDISGPKKPPTATKKSTRITTAWTNTIELKPGPQTCSEYLILSRNNPQIFVWLLRHIWQFFIIVSDDYGKNYEKCFTICIHNEIYRFLWVEFLEDWRKFIYVNHVMSKKKVFKSEKQTSFWYFLWLVTW